jgi:hypothetical protein
MNENQKTLFRASIEVRDYSETNKTVLNPANALPNYEKQHKIVHKKLPQ